MKKIVVCFSGGLNSSTALLLTRAYHSEKQVVAFYVNFGNIFSEKINVMQKFCKSYKISLYEYCMPLSINKYDYSLDFFEQKEILYSDPDMLPFKYGVILSLAISFSEYVNSEFVVIGNSVENQLLYLDSKELFIENFSRTTSMGTTNKIKIIAPFYNMTKDSVVALGLNLNVPYELTRSCKDEFKSRPCLTCNSCINRSIAFIKNKIKDPYLTDEEWEKTITNFK